GVVRPPHAEVRPCALSASETAAPGATVIEVGELMTCWAPAVVPVHAPPEVQVVPGARITVFDVPAAPGGRQNTAPPGGGWGGDVVRKHPGCVGPLTATVVGPQRTPGPWPQP